MNYHPGQPVLRAKCIFGILTAALLVAALPASAHRIEKKFTVEERPVVTIRNHHGRIAVKSWKRPEVQVIGEHADQRIEVDTDKSGNRIDVVTHVLAQNMTPAEMRADYEILVPEETELQVRTDSGSVVIERVFGELMIETVAADVEMREVAGYLVVRTTGGSLVCFRCAGRIEFNSISGGARLLEPVSSNVRAQTFSGDLLYDGDFRPGGIYFLKTTDGKIDVRYSENDSFTLSANSIRGKVESDASLKPPSHSTRPPSGLARGLFGTHNEGLARVELSSFSGIIRIFKRK
jgi:DUF4097 and DUF4098 domain-containing protein YvlB